MNDLLETLRMRKKHYLDKALLYPERTDEVTQWKGIAYGLQLAIDLVMAKIAASPS